MLPVFSTFWYMGLKKKAVYRTGAAKNAAVDLNGPVGIFRDTVRACVRAWAWGSDQTLDLRHGACVTELGL